jgi:hypothetical protein
MINDGRAQGARIEGPEHIEQFAQLAAIHQDWWRSSECTDDRPPGAEQVNCPMEDGNFHLMVRSRLLVMPLEIVQREALARMSHDTARPAPRGPPAIVDNLLGTIAEEVERDTVGGQLEDHRMEVATEQFKTRSLAPPFRPRAVLEGDEGGQVNDPVRDAARGDKSYVRSTAQVTPAMFIDVLRAQTAQPRSSPGVVVEELSEAAPASSSRTIGSICGGSEEARADPPFAPAESPPMSFSPGP